MHHDARVYVELRYDDDSCDVVIVHFRDRGILPIEVKTWEYTLDSPRLGESVETELKDILGDLLLEVLKEK